MTDFESIRLCVDKFASERDWDQFHSPKNLSMAFDSDEAGALATRRSIDLALKRDFSVKVILMEDKDPADIIKKKPEEWLKLIDGARSVMEFYFTYAFAKQDSKSLEGKREIRKTLLTAIKSLASKTEQGEHIKELARRLRVDERDLLADMGKIKTNALEDIEIKTVASEQIIIKTRLDGLEERFLGLCLSCPQHFTGIDISENDFQNAELSQIFKELKKISDKDMDLLVKLRQTLKPELKIKIDYLLLQIEQHERSEKDIIQEIVSCSMELKLLRLRNELSILSFDIKDAQQTKDKDKLSQLLKKFNLISLELTKRTN